MKAWSVNSNSSNSDHCFKYMVRHNKVSAYFDKNTGIDLIEKGDLVLLYHNENRIIAVGFVVKSFEPHEYQKKMGTMDEHWADVNWIWKAEFEKVDDQYNPIDPIDRNDIGIIMTLGTVINVTDQLKYKELFEEIGKRQIYI